MHTYVSLLIPRVLFLFGPLRVSEKGGGEGRREEAARAGGRRAHLGRAADVGGALVELRGNFNFV